MLTTNKLKVNLNLTYAENKDFTQLWRLNQSIHPTSIN